MGKNDPAFPPRNDSTYYGLTRIEYFAAMAPDPTPGAVSAAEKRFPYAKSSAAVSVELRYEYAALMCSRGDKEGDNG